jgi:hypothetical protein
MRLKTLAPEIVFCELIVLWVMVFMATVVVALFLPQPLYPFVCGTGFGAWMGFLIGKYK